MVLTRENDGLMLVRIPPELTKDKGDLILDIPHVIECAMWIAVAAKNKKIVEVTDSATLVKTRMFFGGEPPNFNRYFCFILVLLY